jgi:tRNA pseudouridine38-40 synthase
MYRGWQKQRGSAADAGPSIQETFEEALQKAAAEPKVTVIGSGRTDSGVHANGQVVHFTLIRREWDVNKLFLGLNTTLPRNIRTLAVKKVAHDFHAQRSATHKQYSYYFQQGPAALPHLEPFSWWIRRRLDMDAMREGLSHLIGRHDFKAFQASGAPVGRSTTREILEGEISWIPLPVPFHTSVTGNELGYVRIRLIGTGFLKQMVRGIAGTLREIGEGKRPASDVVEIMRTRDRTQVGATARARGLWLERVWYPGFDW